MKWHHVDNDRELPWKQEKDPYRIWLSEIILQQTRAQQGLPYYLAFTAAYPTVKDLAKANDEDVFRLWQGLGYYNRCKNMLATARYITAELKDKFPASYEGLLSLKGVGPYTAAAIASFAFSLPCAVVDGNVYRVLSRYFGIETAFDTDEGKKEFRALADALLDTHDSAAYNQAIMDLGATVCKPQSPLCVECPLQSNCVAYAQNMMSLLPVRSKKQQIKTRYFHYVLMQAKGSVWIAKRDENDIWQNLYEPYLIETQEPMDKKGVIKSDFFNKYKLDASSLENEGMVSQRLTHRIIEARFFIININKIFKVEEKQGKWVPIDELEKYPFPKCIVSFLEKKLYF